MIVTQSNPMTRVSGMLLRMEFASLFSLRSRTNSDSLRFITVKACRFPLMLCPVFLSSVPFATGLFAQEVSSRRPDIVWNDGSIEFDEDLRSRMQLRPLEDSPEDRRNKAKMTPEQRAQYDRKKQEADAEESMARRMRFATLPEGDSSESGKKYLAAFEQFRAATINVLLSLNEHAVANSPDEKQIEQLEQGWLDSLAAAHQARKQWVTTAAQLFRSDPNKYGKIGLALREMLLYDAASDRYEAWSDATPELLQLDESLLDPEYLASIMTCSYANNDYERAMTAGEKLLKSNRDVPGQKVFIDKFEEWKKNWELEKVKRQKEETANNNPIVELITSKGRIKIELFEDDAPEAVANFIYLIENGYYTKKTFFRVEPHVVAQAGCEKSDGSGNAGYTIRGEATPESHRKHFRGSLAFALGSGEDGKVQRDSGSSQFYISMLPLPHLDGEYTVFGRVVEGIETVGILRQMNLANKEERDEKKIPDLISRAKVLRKRDHEYKPSPVQGKLFR